MVWRRVTNISAVTGLLISYRLLVYLLAVCGYTSAMLHHYDLPFECAVVWFYLFSFRMDHDVVSQIHSIEFERWHQIQIHIVFALISIIRVLCFKLFMSTWSLPFFLSLLPAIRENLRLFWVLLNIVKVCYVTALWYGIQRGLPYTYRKVLVHDRASEQLKFSKFKNFRRSLEHCSVSF